jgi:inward rectifier potassium channel
MPPAASPPPGARRVSQPQGYAFWVVGDERQILRDAYHTFLNMRWSGSLGAIAAGYVAVNLVFAAIYLAVGGVDGVRHGSFVDALSFSVQTLGTIGYGVMHPVSRAADAVMIAESVVGIIVIALATGLVFAKFSRATARVAFSKHAVITTHEGQPTLIFRCGNRRANIIVDAQLRVTAALTRITAEGDTFYKMYDLRLVRDHMAGMRRGWTVMHVIDEASPLYGLDAEGLAKAEVELEISLTGLDSITVQTVHSMHIYTDRDLRPGYRFVDLLATLANGDMVIDLTRFDTIVPDDVPRDSVAA